MLKIKLTRLGKKKEPRYRIVVNEARDKRDGNYVAKVGLYQPVQNPKVLEIDLEAYNKWIAKGAQPTSTVAFLFDRYQSGNPFPEKKAKISKKAKAKLVAAEEEKKVAAEAAAEAQKAEAAEKAESELKNNIVTDNKSHDPSVAESAA